MAKYRKKPVIVDAEQWDGSFQKLHGPIRALAGGPVECVGSKLKIHTLEGTMTADVGDYVIKGTRGELYPVKPGPFEDTFEFISE